MSYITIKQLSDVVSLFPKTPSEVDSQLEMAISQTNKALSDLKSIKTEDRTFDNTARALDIIITNFQSLIYPMCIMDMVSEDKDLRDACKKAVIKSEVFSVDEFNNLELYQAFKSYAELAKDLNKEQQYFVDETMKDFIRSGLALPENEQTEIKDLQKEISKLTIEFESNINKDKSSFVIPKDDLRGLSDDFISQLENKNGEYIVTCDYPVYLEVMSHCEVAKTREKLYLAFNNRAHPENTELLQKIANLRDKRAKKLGFNNFADYQLDSEMVKTSSRAEKFILDLIDKVTAKAHKEVEDLSSDLPDGVVLVDNKLQPWDITYVKSAYKKKHFELDEREIAEYFPMEKAINALFKIYEKFFSLQFNIVKPSWCWNEDVQLIEVYKNNKLIGYIFLDLYPRPNKYSHACHAGFIDGLLDRPSAAVVIANFPKPTEEKPSLLKHSDVVTFFHEFGHAMHCVLGKTDLASFSGTATTTDFVEMPSQMFEEWMWDNEMLKSVSGHYKTGNPLPDELINKMLNLKNFDSGYSVLRQCIFSLVSLYLHKDQNVDPSALVYDLSSKYYTNIRTEPSINMAASFGHLTGYGSKYYGYMWSRVFAHDMFETIKKMGLLNPDAGDKLVSEVLGKGGSVDPNELLKDFLGREPSQDAFLKNNGFV